MKTTPMSTATITAMPTIMSTDIALPPASLLQLIWLASPALPVGGFSYSEGLEAAVDRAWVATETDAGDWLVDQLHLTQARAVVRLTGGTALVWRGVSWLDDDVFAISAFGAGLAALATGG